MYMCTQSNREHSFYRQKKTKILQVKFNYDAKFWRSLGNVETLRFQDGDGQNKLLQINGSKDSSSYIINRMNLIQF
jgi:hypothetical protein